MLVGGIMIKVIVAVAVGKGVFVAGMGVSVGGMLTAVWVAAAFAVSTMAVRGAFGSNVGSGAGVEPNVGTHARVRISAVASSRTLVRRSI